MVLSGVDVNSEAFAKLLAAAIDEAAEELFDAAPVVPPTYLPREPVPS